MDSTSFFEDPRHEQWMQIAQELYRRTYALEAPEAIYDWLTAKTGKLRPDDNSSAVMTWPQSFELYAQEIARRVALSKLPPEERLSFNWPWTSWNNFIDPAEAGILAILAGPDGSGKCLGRGTPVLMFDGTIRPVETLQVGDVLLGPDSKARRILSLSRGREPMYWIRQTAGMDYQVNGNHVLALLRRNEDGSKTLVEMTVNEVRQLKHGYLQRYIQGYKVPVEFPTQDVPLDPYFLGLWLGDGASKTSTIYNPDYEIIEWLRAFATTMDCGIKVTSNNDRDTCWKITISNGRGGGEKRNANTPTRKLGELGVLDNKHIPPQYLYNSADVRLRLLAGLLDSDGSYARKGFEITQKREYLARQIKFLADSLGFRTHIAAKQATIKARDFSCTVWRVMIGGDVTRIPLRVARKIPAARTINKDWRVTGITVDEAGVDDFFGFTLDGDGLFLLGDMTVTHNSSYAECIAEHWAHHGHHVVFVHFELSKIIMLDRRAARHTAIARRRLKLAGELTPTEFYALEEAKARLLAWPGEITYLHTPGQSLELVLRALAPLRAAGQCDAVIIDYLEKAAPAAAQLKAYGSDGEKREAADVEMLKSWSEQHEVPLLALSQFTKYGKNVSFSELDRGAIRGSGQKTDKANVVILLHPDKNHEGVIDVRLDKNTLGPTGTFRQFLDAPHFQVGDVT
jgi:replicative DNA helicase